MNLKHPENYYWHIHLILFIYTNKHGYFIFIMLHLILPRIDSKFAISNHVHFTISKYFLINFEKYHFLQ